MGVRKTMTGAFQLHGRNGHLQGIEQGCDHCTRITDVACTFFGIGRRLATAGPGTDDGTGHLRRHAWRRRGTANAGDRFRRMADVSHAETAYPQAAPLPRAPGRDRRAAALDEFSFPSGHTLHAVSFTVIATAWFPFLVVLLVLFTVLVAMSRVALRLHYPSDVLVGVLIGAVLGTVSVWSSSIPLLAMV